MLGSVLCLSTSARVTRRLNLLAYDSWHLAPLNSVSYFIETIHQSARQFGRLKAGKIKHKGYTKEIMGKERIDKEGQDVRLNERNGKFNRQTSPN